jgi:hypothetical protein
MFRACGKNVYATNIAAIDLPHYPDHLQKPWLSHPKSQAQEISAKLQSHFLSEVRIRDSATLCDR